MYKLNKINNLFKYVHIGLYIIIMTYKVEENNNISIVHLNGEIDMEVADKARQQFYL